MRSIYVAGPMTGLPLYNWPAFEAAASFLRHMGWAVICPTEIDEELGHVEAKRNEFGDIISVDTTDLFDYEIILGEDIKRVLTVDAIFLLPNWHKSTGARRELAAYLGKGGTEIILNLEVFVDARQ